MDHTRSRIEKTRYLAVQLLTRGGDWIISNLIVFYGGPVLFAMAVGSSFNGVVGYHLQKTHVFEFSQVEGRHETPKKFRTFLVLRVPLGLLGAAIIWVLCFTTSTQYYWIYSLIAMGILWYVTYKPQKDIFTGSVRTLPRSVRISRVLSLRSIPRFLFSVLPTTQ